MTEKGWCIKWGLINRIGQDTQLKADNEHEANQVLSRCMDLVHKLDTHQMSLLEVVTIMAINQLLSQFDTLKKIMRNNAKSKSEIPSLQDVIQDVIQDVKDDIRNRKTPNVTANLVEKKGTKGKGQGGGKGGGGKGEGKDDKDDGPVCTCKPCGKKGHTEPYCFLKFGRDVVLAKIAKEHEEKKAKEASGLSDKKDEKKNSPWDVTVMTALNCSSASTRTKALSSNMPADVGLDQLQQMVNELKGLD